MALEPEDEAVALALEKDEAELAEEVDGGEEDVEDAGDGDWAEEERKLRAENKQREEENRKKNSKMSMKDKVSLLDNLLCCTGRGIGHGELVLQKAGRAVDAVPVLHAIERMEERGNRLQLSDTVLGRLAIPGLVERPHRELVQQAARQKWRRRGQGLRVVVERVALQVWG